MNRFVRALFISAFLVVGVATQYAHGEGCTPSQLEKMRGGGFSKSEIKEMCEGVQGKTPKPDKSDKGVKATKSDTSNKPDKGDKATKPPKVTKPEESNTASLLSNPSMFRKGEIAVGAEYILYTKAGIGVKASYFLFDDLAVEAEYEMPVDSGGASITIINLGGVYHMMLGNIGNDSNFGWYGGAGYTYGKSSYSSSYSNGTSIVATTTSQDLSSLYFQLGVEMKFDSPLKAHVGYIHHMYPGGGSNGGGLLIGVAYSF